MTTLKGSVVEYVEINGQNETSAKEIAQQLVNVTTGLNRKFFEEAVADAIRGMSWGEQKLISGIVKGRVF